MNIIHTNVTLTIDEEQKWILTMKDKRLQINDHSFGFAQDEVLSNIQDIAGVSSSWILEDIQ